MLYSEEGYLGPLSPSYTTERESERERKKEREKEREKNRNARTHMRYVQKIS
jgi:hypothetical protein